MALKLRTTLSPAAVLAAQPSIPDVLAAIPGARNFWDLSLKGAEMSGGAPVAIPTVFGPDRLDSLTNTAPGSRTLVTRDGIPGLKQTGQHMIGTSTFTGSGDVAAGWCIAMLMRLDDHVSGIRMATLGAGGNLGRLMFQNVSSYKNMFTGGAVTRQVITPVGWHGLIFDFDGTKMRALSVREGYAVGVSGVLNFGEYTPAAGTFTTATGLQFGPAVGSEVGATFGACYWGTQSVWGTPHQATLEKWLRYRLGIS